MQHAVEDAEPERYPDGQSWIEEDGAVFLLGGQCRDCRKRAFPKPRICDTCHCERIDLVRLSRTGIVYAFTTVHVAPHGFDSPYVLAYVDLPEDVRVLGQVQVDHAGIEVGSAVEVQLGVIKKRDDGHPVVGYVFQAGATS